MKSIVSILFLASALVFTGTSTAAAFNFTPGDYYATNGMSYYRPSISQYSQDGTLKASLELGLQRDTAIKGIAYHDGLMYGVVHDLNALGGYAVVALDQTGSIHEVYRQSGGFSYLWNGGISFDKGGNFYVVDAAGVSRFTVGDPNSVKRIATVGGTKDAKILKNGIVMLINDLDLREMASDGSIIRTIELSDPSKVAGDYYPSLSGASGIEVDSSTGEIFVTTAGNSKFNILKMDGGGRLLAVSHLLDAGDIFLTEEKKVVIGSAYFNSPGGIFTENLDRIGGFQGGNVMFFTQIPTVPEPSAIVLFVAGLFGLVWITRANIFDSRASFKMLT